MKHKVIGIIEITAVIITIFSSVIYLMKDFMIPGLPAFSISVLMLSLVYSTKQQFGEGKVSRKHLRVIIFLGLIGGIGNIIAGILQVIFAIIK